LQDPNLVKQLELVQAEVDQLYAEEEDLGQNFPKSMEEEMASEHDMMEGFISLIGGEQAQRVTRLVFLGFCQLSTSGPVHLGLCTFGRNRGVLAKI